MTGIVRYKPQSKHHIIMQSWGHGTWYIINQYIAIAVTEQEGHGSFISRPRHLFLFDSCDLETRLVYNRGWIPWSFNMVCFLVQVASDKNPDLRPPRTKRPCNRHSVSWLNSLTVAGGGRNNLRLRCPWAHARSCRNCLKQFDLMLSCMPLRLGNRRTSDKLPFGFAHASEPDQEAKNNF